MATIARHRVDAVTHPGWFTPPRLLSLFCLMSLLVYVDRGVISSAAVSGSPRVGAGDPGSGLQGEFGVGYALFGLLQAAFMLGLLIGAPAFSAAAKTWNPFKLIGLGLAGWTLAAAGCATATTYAAFFACRVFVGLGEASFCALAAPFIDDVAPPGRKTLWLATFYLCIPLGVAGGVMFGGAVAGAPESAHALGWRWAFGLEAVAMAPVALFCLASGPVPMRGVDERAARLRSGGGEMTSADDLATLETEALLSADDFPERARNAVSHAAALGTRHATENTEASDLTLPNASDSRDSRSREISRDFASLRRNRAFLTALAGYVAYTGTVGVYAAWGPKAGFGVYASDLGTPSRSDVVLGGITVVAGVAGTLAGGVAADSAGADARAAIRVCAVSGAVAFAFLELAFWVDTFAAFAVLFFLGQAFAFGVQAPVNAVVLRSVRARERPLACSLVTVIIHALGDVPTPPLFGLALEASAGGGGGAPTPANWRAVLGGFTALMAVAAATWAAGAGAMASEASEDSLAQSPSRASGGSPEALASPAASSEREGARGDDASGASRVHPGNDRGFESASVPFLSGGAEGSAAVGRGEG